MTIAYVIDYDINLNSGVVEKVLQQCNVWIKQGHKVYVVSTKTLTIYDNKRKIIYALKPLNIKFGQLGTVIKLLFNSYKLKDLMNELDVDIIYMRYMLYTPFLNNEIKKYKTIMEINSDDSLEYKMHSKLTYLYNKLTRKFVFRNISGFVCVSDELNNKWQVFNKPSCTIANGIDTTKYILQKNCNNRPTIVFIGTPNQPWHGLEKIIKMSIYFKKYDFYIIGSKGEDTENLKYFGYLSQAESSTIIQKCDIGIGTLSLYKNKLNEASPLKTRQYLACGLPIIYAYKDTDISSDASFVLQLKNSKNNINYEEVNEFITKCFHNANIQKQARNFAENILDYNFKEYNRLNFFEEILNAK